MTTRQGFGHALGLVLALGMAGPAAAGTTTIGIVLPEGSLAANAQAAEPLRQSVVDQLRLRAVEAIELSTPASGAVDAEAQAKNCAYVLYLHAEQKHGAGGFFSKLGSIAGALPMGALAGHGGGGGGGLMGAAMQQVATQATSSAEQQAMSKMMGSQQTAVAPTATTGLKRGDTVSLEYRLVPIGGGTAIKSETLSAKVSADGEDVLSPLVTQLAGAVNGSAQGTAGTGTPAASAGPSPVDPAEPPAQQHSFLGGLFGHKNAPAAPAQATRGQIDCSQIAAMGGQSATGYALPVSVAECEKMKSAQQAYNQEGSDPSAMRPGDDSMTCDQITAELKQQPFTAPDKTQVGKLTQTVNQVQTDVANGIATSRKLQAENQATVDAAMAADRATALATGGLVQGQALQAAEKVNQARTDAANRENLAATAPHYQAMMTQMTDFASTSAAQMAANPRMARLLQLASAKRCHGG